MTSGMRELPDTWERDFIGFWHRDIYLLIAQVAFMKLAIALIAILAALCIPPGAGENAAGDNAEYWSNLGDQQFLNGSIQEAAESYDEALRLDPANVYLWVNKGKSMANMGRFEDAIACFDQASAINSSYVEPLFLKGIALSQGLKRDDEAIAVFDQALQLDPSNFDAWLGKGMALANKGDYYGSLACLKTASRIDPLQPSGWNNEGVILLKMGRYQEALDCFDKALLLDPNYEQAERNRNNTLQDMNRIVFLGSR